MYNLNDRYYDSNIGRFLTADDPSYLGANGDLLSYNLYAYCSNNPVMYVDPTGYMPEWVDWALSGIAIAIGVGLCATGAGGFLGNMLGTIYTNWHNSDFQNIDVDIAHILKMSAISGSLNVFAGIGSGISYIISGLPNVPSRMDSIWACRIMAGAISGETEAIYDLSSYLINKLIESIDGR